MPAASDATGAARVLLLDDDPSLRDVLSLVLEDAGYVVETAPDGRAGLALHASFSPDLIVCDVNMPHVDGFTFCRELRGRADTTPILILTSRDSEVDEALGLDLGADDYVVKPTSNRVLLARVAALLRRRAVRERPPDGEEFVRVGELALSIERMEARYAGERLDLTVTEFRLVQALASGPGRVRSRGQLLDAIRGDDSVVAERIVDTYVRSVRRKFERVAPGFDRIETRIGAGYRWRDEP